MRSLLFASLALVALALMGPSTYAQVPDPVVAAEAPREGVGHHYIGNGVETVNPADGTVNFNLPLTPPAGRQISFPFGIRYTGSAQFFLSNSGSHTSQLYWYPSDTFGSGPVQVGGWSYDAPTLSATTSIFWSATIPNNGCPNGVCTYSTNYCFGNDSYVFRGLDGNQYSLPLGDVFADPNNQDQQYCPSPSASVKSPGNNHGILSYFQSSSVTTVVDHSGTIYQFPGGSGQPTEPYL